MVHMGHMGISVYLAGRVVIGLQEVVTVVKLAALLLVVVALNL